MSVNEVLFGGNEGESHSAPRPEVDDKQLLVMRFPLVMCAY